MSHALVPSSQPKQATLPARTMPPAVANYASAEPDRVAPAHILERLRALIEGPGSAEERLDQVRAELQAARVRMSQPKTIPLTGRQMATLELLSQGLSNRTIARRLQIGEATVKTHIKGLLERLNLPNRTSLVLWAIRQGLVSPYGDQHASEVSRPGG
jgi:DNA-binding NarL/FixJ family response regulator